jgi:phage pi2 protein 07
MPVSLGKQEIWHYNEAPVFYDDFLQAHYPFKYPLVREIEAGKYEARYRITDESGKERNVVYADQIDNQEEAEERLDYDGGPFSYSYYDVTTNHDKAILTLHKENDGDIYKAAIYGRPIVLDLNRSCFISDSEGIAAYGTAALNVTGSYFSEYEINGKPQYEDWVIRELAERLQNRREFTVKTHRALFHARVGAKVKIQMRNEKLEMKGKINAFSFRYKRDKAFIASFRITEAKSNED